MYKYLEIITIIHFNVINTHLAKDDFFFLMMCPCVDVHIIFLHSTYLFFFLVLCPHTTIKQPTSISTSLF